MSPTLTLHYYVLGDDSSRILGVKIEALKSVDALKEAIKAEESPRFDHVSAKALYLWRVSVPYDDEIDDETLTRRIQKLYLVYDSFLPPLDVLSEVFSDPPLPRHIHIVVKPPPPEPADDMEAPTAPSSRTQIERFRQLQSNPNHAIYCGRPPTVPSPTPVTLLHPIFGQFVDECKTHVPTREDYALVSEMSRVMLNIHPDEASRKDAILGLLERHEIPLRRDTRGSTNTDILHLGFPLVIVEFLGGSAEPYARAALHYLESTKDCALSYSPSPLPCIIITIFGPHLSFSGAVWDNRPCVEVLSAAIPFNFHQTDTYLKSMAARQLGAFKNTLRRLRDYYTDTVPELKDVPIPYDSLFPHPTSFASLIDPGENCEFTYSSREAKERLVFFGSLLDDDTNICIKFVRYYSPAVHQQLAKQGLAPRLLGFEPVSGGWHMVVMDRLILTRAGEGYVDLYRSLHDPYFPIYETLRTALYDTMRKCLAELHEAGFVHGDIRASNIMVPMNREVKFLLLDFDWAGEIGKARYPANVYRGNNLWRPEGVDDGALITADHDMQMLDYIFTIQIPRIPDPRTSASHGHEEVLSAHGLADPSKRSLGASPETNARKRQRET